MEGKYKVGQRWSYETREGEEDSSIIIVHTSNHAGYGEIINIYLEGVHIPGPDGNTINVISHLPFAAKAIDESVSGLLEADVELPDFEEGYQQWKQEFDAGNAGIFTITVKQVAEYMEQVIAQ